MCYLKPRGLAHKLCSIGHPLHSSGCHGIVTPAQMLGASDGACLSYERIDTPIDLSGYVLILWCELKLT